MKSLNKKQRPYGNVVKNITPNNEGIYETYKNLFEPINSRSKNKFKSKERLTFKGDARKYGMS